MSREDFLRHAALSGQFQQGWAHFCALEHPSPEERRWAGGCAAYLGMWDAAQQQLEQAAQGGYLAAHIHLALIHRIKTNKELARLSLGRLEHVVLEPLERCMYLLELGMEHTAGHRLREARRCLEQGWQLSFEATDGEWVRPGLALALGVVRLTMGAHGPALVDFEHAKLGGPGRAALAGGYRAVALAYTGQFLEAKNELEQVASKVDSLRGVLSLLDYWRGTVLRLEGHFVQARVSFEAAVRYAYEQGEEELEAHALLGLSACMVRLEDKRAARATLMRAKPLCLSAGLEALWMFRQGQFERSSELLQVALNRFDALGMARDAFYASLNMADCTLEESQRDALLEDSADRLHALGGFVSLDAELGGLARVKTLLEHLPQSHYLYSLRPAAPQPSTRKLELRVLGGNTLLLENRPVKTHYAQSPTVLYYLLRNPGRTVGQLVADLFPERPYKQASQYFYKVRLALNAAIPGLEVQNDPRTGCRVLLDGLSLSVDALELRTLLERGEVEAALEKYATLLPNAEGDWVQEERDQLMNFMTRVAVKSINDNYEAGNFERCVKIAAHILTCDPFDPVLNDLYLQALRELHGPMVAQQTAYQVREKFAREGLEPPYELEAFVRSSLN